MSATPKHTYHCRARQRWGDGECECFVQHLKRADRPRRVAHRFRGMKRWYSGMRPPLSIREHRLSRAAASERQRTRAPELPVNRGAMLRLHARTLDGLVAEVQQQGKDAGLSEADIGALQALVVAARKMRSETQ